MKFVHIVLGISVFLTVLQRVIQKCRKSLYICEKELL